MDKTLAHISYISWRKVNELYDQFNDQNVIKTLVSREKGGEGKLGTSGSFFSFLEGNAEVKGTLKTVKTEEQQQTLMGKFQRVLKHIEKNNLITDLNVALEVSGGKIPGSFCYKYTGRFESFYQDMGMIRYKDEKHHLSVDRHLRTALEEESGEREDKRLWQQNCLLISHTGNLTIELAASLKYFAQTEGRSDSGDFYPTSSNMFFFEGKVRPVFDVVFFIVGTSTGVVYGTPLAIIYNAQEEINLQL